MDSNPSDINPLNRIVWRTAISGRLERFAVLLNDPEAQKYFGEDFVTKLSAKIERLFRLILVLGAIYAILMLSLFAAQDPNKTEFQILGYSFKNLGHYKEFLLFVAALLSPISSGISAYHRYLSEIRKVALKKLFPNPQVLEFAAHIYSDGYADPLIKDSQAAHIRPHGFTVFLVAAFGIVFLAVLIALLASSFILQIAVIYDVASNPSSSPFINGFIVVFSLGAIALSWLIGLLQLPLPEVDLGAYTKLSELRQSNQQQYQETMKRLSADSARREQAWSIGSAVAIFVFTYSAIAIFLFSQVQLSLWPLLFKSIPGIAFAIIVATFVASRIKRTVYRNYFRKYPEGTDPEFNLFSRATKIIGISRLGLTFITSIAYSLMVITGR
ncbi:hypothetical protein [Sedimenticola selenatireducens]|uniref:hypothetical protein n=1 Tax=Sedimenticola selenatireducens TaxID=191960 RepID=UPI002AABE412|nr:hypothetical protein [Sedimenticola selenatireducens]